MASNLGCSATYRRRPHVRLLIASPWCINRAALHYLAASRPPVLLTPLPGTAVLHQRWRLRFVPSAQQSRNGEAVVVALFLYFYFILFYFWGEGAFFLS